MRTKFHTFSAILISSSLLFVAPLALTGCHGDSSSRMANEGLVLGVSASSNNINQGEIVTFMVQDQNTLGKDIDIKWTSNGGDIKTEKDKRVARVQFDKPGTYSVSAEFWVDGNSYKTVTKVVTVNRLPS